VSKGPVILLANWENPLQLVPNCQAITSPGITPIPKLTAKIFDQKVVQRTPYLFFGFQPYAFQHRQIAGEPDGDGREDYMDRDGNRELYSRQVKCIQIKDLLAPDNSSGGRISPAMRIIRNSGGVFRYNSC